PPIHLDSISFADPATSEVYTLSLHDALPILALAVGAEPGDRAVLAQLGDPVDDPVRQRDRHRHQLGGLVRGVAEHQPLVAGADVDRKSTRLNSSHDQISYAVFCLKKKTTNAP